MATGDCGLWKAISMSFRKRNYQRGKIKKYHQQKLNTLVKNKTEPEIKEIHQLFLNYDVVYKAKTSEFETGISNKFTKEFFLSARRFYLIQQISNMENQVEYLKSKMKELGLGFKPQSILGKIFNPDSDPTFFLKSDYGRAVESLKEFQQKLSERKPTLDTYCFQEVEKYFMSEFSAEFEERCKNLDPIGVTVQLSDGQISFGFKADEISDVVNGKKACDTLNVNLNYVQDYGFFSFDKIAVAEYFKEKFSKINKKKEERNLRALAAEKTEKQRSIATSGRTQKEFMNQVSIVDCCPYCGGDLGNFTGNNVANFEHIHPVSKGGLSTIENTVFICGDCNSRKSNMTLNKFLVEASLDRDAVFKRLNLLEKDF